MPTGVPDAGGPTSATGWLAIQGLWFVHRPSLAIHTIHLLKKHPEAMFSTGYSDSNTHEEKTERNLGVCDRGPWRRTTVHVPTTIPKGQHPCVRARPLPA